MDKKTLKLNSKRHLQKNYTGTTYICSRIQENTESNLRKVLELLTEITNDEHYYNYELSNTTDRMRTEVGFILKECYEEQNIFKSIFDE